MKLNKKNIFRYGMLACSLIFCLCWFGVDGIRVEPDTGGYVNFSMSREPLYPTVLALFRWVFGEVTYFVWVGLFQSILYGYAIWFFCDRLAKQLKMEPIAFSANWFICVFVNLLTRFLAGRKSMYFLDITSEGIAIPIFLLFSINLYIYTINQKKKNLFATLIYGLLLILTRKQMYIVVPILGLVFLVMCILKKITIRKLVGLWGMVIAMFGTSILADVCYNMAVRGETVRHTADSSCLLITAIYTADESDAELIPDRSVRELFLEIVGEKNAQELGYAGEAKFGLELAEHYAQHFDEIAFGIVNPAIYHFVELQGVEGYVEAELAFGEVNDYLLSCILKENIPRMIVVFTANALSGFCNTVAKSSRMISTAVCLLYLIWGTIWILTAKHKEMNDEFMLGIVTIICVVVNVVAVSVMIFAQSRYMIYNMPIFYGSLFAMMRKLILTRRKEQ